MLEFLFGKAQPRVLAADDDENVRELVVDVLSAKGYRVTPVKDGQEAVQQLRKNRFDLVILDVHMPGLEGPQVLEFIRLLPKGSEIGVIMLTAERATSTFASAHELGIHAYLDKPFSPLKLLETVGGYFDRKTPK